MAAVGSHVPLVSPVLGAEHHEHKDSGKFHKPRPTRSERVKRGRQRDKARLQALRDQLADFSTSSASASDDSSQHSALTQRLNAALSRVSALEERIDHLLAIIAHLTATADDTSGQASQGATAELFDLFKDHVADAETQTSISFDWSRPDVFVHLQDLERCASISRASSHTCDAAHADAAAGVASDISGLRSQFQVSKEESPKDTAASLPEASAAMQADTSLVVSQSLATAHATPRQAPEVVNARHRGHQSHADAGSAQVVGETVGDFNSQNLALHSELLNHTSCSEHIADIPWQAPDVAHARHHGHHATDGACKSQNLAPDHAIESETGYSPPGHAIESEIGRCVLPDHAIESETGLLPPGRAIESEIGRNTSFSHDLGNVAHSPGVVRADFHSQDLAPSSEIIGTVSTTQCGPLPRHGKPDAPDLELLSANLVSDSNSQAHATLRSPWHELEPHEPKVAPSLGPSTTSKDLVCEFNSHSKDLENPSLATKDLSRTLRPSERESQRAFPKTQQPQAAVLPQGFVQVASTIIEVYGKRRKPQRNHLLDAATALIRVAQMHEVAFEDCQHFVGGKSSALECAMTELGHTA